MRACLSHVSVRKRVNVLWTLAKQPNVGIRVMYGGHVRVSFYLVGPFGRYTISTALYTYAAHICPSLRTHT